METMKNFFENIIETYSKYDNLDTSIVINDVIRGMTFRG